MRSIFALLAAAALFAGCTEDGTDEDDHEHAMDAHTYMLHALHMPDGHVAPGSTFTFHNQVGGHVEGTSDHIGAHFWNMTQAHPTENISAGVGCAHVTGDLPDTYEVTCTAPMEPGTYYLRAHARIVDGEDTWNWWSDEETFTVA